MTSANEAFSSLPWSGWNAQVRFEEHRHPVVVGGAQQTEALEKAEAAFHSHLTRASGSELTFATTAHEEATLAS